MQQLALRRHRLRTRDGIGPLHVSLGDLVAAHRDDPLGDHRLHVLAGDADIAGVDLHASHLLGVAHRLADRLRRFLDVGDDAAPNSGRACLTDAENLDARMTRQVADDLRDDGGRLGGSDIQSGDQAFNVHGRRAMTRSL